MLQISQPQASKSKQLSDAGQPGLSAFYSISSNVRVAHQPHHLCSSPDICLHSLRSPRIRLSLTLALLVRQNSVLLCGPVIRCVRSRWFNSIVTVQCHCVSIYLSPALFCEKFPEYEHITAASTVGLSSNLLRVSDARYISVSPYRRYNPTVVHVQGQEPQSITGETLRPYIKLFSSLLGVTPVHIKIIPLPCSIIMPCKGNPTPPRIPERIPAPLVPVVGGIRDHEQDIGHLLSERTKLNRIHHLCNNAAYEQDATPDGQFDIHVFSSICLQVSPYAEGTGQHDIRVVIPVNPIQIVLLGSIDFISREVDLSVNLLVPFQHHQEAGRFQGRLVNAGIHLNFDVSGVAQGSFTLYTCDSVARDPYVPNSKAERVNLQGEMMLFGTRRKFKVKLFPFPRVRSGRYIKLSDPKALIFSD